MPTQRSHRHRAVQPGGTVGTLHLVASPLGDPEDITLRALRVLREVDLVAAEDTRVAARLLAHHGLGRPIVSYHDHAEARRAPELVQKLLSGVSVALLSDAGTPLVSDPGFRLVAACLEAGVPVNVLPGPCAAVAGLCGSGLPVDRFHFLGFLPRDPRPLLAEVAGWRGTLVAYESPLRLAGTLRVLAETWPDRRVCVARNLTKEHEQWIRGTAAEALEVLGDETRGEVTLLVEGAGADAPAVDVDAEIDRLLADGVEPRALRDLLAARTGRPKREIYARILARRSGP